MELTDKYDFEEGTKLTWPLKLLFFFGGLITMSTMLVLLCVFSKETSKFFGICMMITSIVMTRIINNEKLILSVAYPLFFVGQVFTNIFIFVIGNDTWSFNNIIIINVLILTIACFFCRNHFMRQCILLAIFVLVPLTLINKKNQVFYHIFFYYAILLWGVYALTIKYDANRFEKENLYTHYIPTIRFCAALTAIGYAFTSVIFVIMGRIDTIFKTGNAGNGVFESVVCALFTFIVAYKLLSREMKGTKNFIWCIALTLLGCVASCISPNIAIAMLGLVLTYTVLDYFGVAICGLFLIFALSVFYYNLEIMLIYKSYLLMGSGVVFLSIFYFLKKLSK